MALILPGIHETCNRLFAYELRPESRRKGRLTTFFNPQKSILPESVPFSERDVAVCARTFKTPVVVGDKRVCDDAHFYG